MTSDSFTESLLGPGGSDTLLPLGVLGLLVTGVGSYTLVLLGQWRCLMHAPQRQNAKELMLVCFLCVLVCSACSLIGAVFDGQEIYNALRLGPAGLDQFSLQNTGTVLLLGGALLGVVASLVFSQFLRTLACCFGDERRARQVDFNLAFIGLLLGGSIGAAICFWGVVPRVTILPALAAGWLLSFGWHLLLIVSVRRCIDNALHHVSGLWKAVAPQQAPRQAPMHSLSGLRRLMRTPGS
jgi:hypothetical protein